MNTPKSTNIRSAVPAIEAETIMPAASLDVLITVLMHPETRQHATARLDARIEARSKELGPLLHARKALNTLDNNTSRIEIENQVKIVNPCTITHVLAIALVLENEKNGLTFSGLRAKLDKIGHPIEYKTLQNTVRRMIKRGEIKAKGSSGKFIYKLSVKL